MALVDVLIPTVNRKASLAVTLVSLYYQSFSDFSLIISDQTTPQSVFTNQLVKTALTLHKTKRRNILQKQNLPRCGIAQQRQLLLEQSTSPYSLFLDDDVILEPFVIEKMVEAIKEEACGFVGRAVIGLSYRDDYRLKEQNIEFWQGKVMPETVTPTSAAWNRHKLHNAANLWHLEKRLKVTAEKQKKYKVAWIGGCVLFDRKKLIKSGGFSFWQKLPPSACGEDVLAQLKVMKRFGGCGLLPSGVYHQELATTIPNREDNAPHMLSL